METLVKFQNSRLGLALHVLVQVFVLLGIPVGGYFAQRVIGNTERLIRVETQIESGLQEQIENIEHTYSQRWREMTHKLERLDDKVDQVLRTVRGN